ncbi:MAG: hypothetical protein IT210_17870 [Armatimonadetes bacterium]|nr:hypothetical protein [Armatimonadota bacterium]
MQGGVPIKTLCPGNQILIGLCLADTVSTLILTSMGGMEANPIMAYFLNRGAWHFVLAKIASFAPAVVLLENYRRRRPETADRMIYITIFLYLSIYIVAFMRVNFG